MKRTLSLSQNILVGSMLFGMFFGAGNLIFPVHLGQEAGSNIFLANIGFMLTAIGRCCSACRRCSPSPLPWPLSWPPTALCPACSGTR